MSTDNTPMWYDGIPQAWSDLTPAERLHMALTQGRSTMDAIGDAGFNLGPESITQEAISILAKYATETDIDWRDAAEDLKTWLVLRGYVTEVTISDEE